MESLVGTLFGRIDKMIFNPKLVEVFHKNDIDKSLLQKLEILLPLAAAVLRDAEDPLAVKWVNELQNAAFDADDLLDELTTKFNQEGAASKLVDFILSLKPLVEGLKSRLDRMFESFTFIIDYKDRLRLIEGDVGKSLPLASFTTSLKDDKHQVYGRDRESKEIIDFLLSDRKSVSVVAIVGMAGIGKTALAQLLYNDQNVASHFQIRSWTSISETTSDVCEITKKILESFTRSYSNITDLNVLQIKLKETLKGQRYLLVLDGFRNENSLDWDILRRPLESEVNGSMVVVTTRSQGVSMATQADLTHSISLLSNEDTWKLFSSYAFKSGNPDEYPVLGQIGKRIVEKCKGLPLAAKALGSLLHSKDDAEEWEAISNSTIWELPNNNSNILSTLRLSYSQMPFLLQQCFAYCSIYPKGHQIEKWDLIYLWMAQGILPQPETKKRMLDIGNECFQELLSRSFFYEVTVSKKQYFMMHDLIHDLAQYVAGDFCLNLSDSQRNIKTWVRHFSYLESGGVVDKLISNKEFGKLRTFLPFIYSQTGDRCTPPNLVEHMLKMENPLRVLSLRKYNIDSSVSVTNSLHLRYLNLSDTLIDYLPDFVCKCYNLETLILSHCSLLKKLPDKIFNLVNLRHLDIGGTNLIEMPKGFGRLKSLQVLSDFIVSSGGGSKISELGEVSELHGALLIANLQNVANAKEASSAGLRSKKYLNELVLKWTTTNHNKLNETEVLSMLVPHRNVKRVKIRNLVVVCCQIG